MSQPSKVLKFDRYRWEPVKLREYKSGDARFRGVTRQTLLGEGSGEEPLSFLTRYEICGLTTEVYSERIRAAHDPR